MRIPQEGKEYLVFIISKDRVKPDPVKTHVISDWTTPKIKKEIECFLGFCNFYRQFIEGLSRMAKLPFHRSKKDYNGKWQWGDMEHTAFDELRTKLTTSLILVHFIPGVPTKLETDASKYVCSRILLQQCDDGKW